MNAALIEMPTVLHWVAVFSMRFSYTLGRRQKVIFKKFNFGTFDGSRCERRMKLHTVCHQQLITAGHMLPVQFSLNSVFSSHCLLCTCCFFVFRVDFNVPMKEGKITNNQR